MTAKKSRTQIASAVSLALSSMMLSAGVNAGTIDDTYLTGVGAFDLSNVVIDQVNAETGAFISVFTINDNGTYTPAMAPNTTFVSKIYDPLTMNSADPTTWTQMARLTGKDYPIGEPTGIKAINDDQGDMRADSPKNCLLSTSYLGGSGLNLADPTLRQPTLCSSDFQSHKRFKVSMLGATVVADGQDGNPIDLIIKVADEDEDQNTVNLRPYQVYSKINNYTGKRLSGYKVQVGRYVDEAGTTVFRTAKELNIQDRLHISLGLGEGTTGAGVLNGSNIFDPEDLATFSFGLFGDASTSANFKQDGFFDNQRAGFNVEQACSTGALADCGSTQLTGYENTTIYYSDTIQTTGAMESNYVTLFGDWLHEQVQPRGLFYDDDDDRATDDVLMAWWDGTNWLKPAAVRPTGTEFDVVSATEFNSWANAAAGESGEKPYYVSSIEDVLNLGPNYILKVGDGIGGDFVIRIIPTVADAESQAQPTPWMDNLPAEGDLVPVTDTATTSGGGGGGCAVGGNGRIDPTLPALLAMGLGFFGWRRFKAGK